MQAIFTVTANRDCNCELLLFLLLAPPELLRTAHLKLESMEKAKKKKHPSIWFYLEQFQELEKKKITTHGCDAHVGTAGCAVLCAVTHTSAVSRELSALSLCCAVHRRRAACVWPTGRGVSERPRASRGHTWRRPRAWPDKAASSPCRPGLEASKRSTSL